MRYPSPWSWFYRSSRRRDWSRSLCSDGSQCRSTRVCSIIKRTRNDWLNEQRNICPNWFRIPRYHSSHVQDYNRGDYHQRRMEIWSWRLVCPLMRIECALLMNSPLAIDLVERGLVDLKPLLTHTFKFTDALEAFEITKAGKDKDGKFVIKCVIDGPE
jgi:hypothetical protein